jgi:hypothetical protein
MATIKNSFRIGDKIRRTASGAHKCPIGFIGTIKSFDSSNDIELEEMPGDFFFDCNFELITHKVINFKPLPSNLLTLETY